MNGVANDSKDGIHKAQYTLFASHALSAWGQRAWEFLVGLVMLEIARSPSGESSLILVSAFGVVDSVAVTAFAGRVGAWIDRQPRLKAAKTMYFIQNFAVALSACACVPLISKGEYIPMIEHRSAMYWILVVVAILCGAASSLGATGATLSVEREWVKALCQNNSIQLAKMNSVMKRIDLSCLILSPIFVGMAMSFNSLSGVLAVFVWHMAVWWPECALLERAQRICPTLAISAIRNNELMADNAHRNIFQTSQSSSDLIREDEKEDKNVFQMVGLQADQEDAAKKTGTSNSVHLYFKQPAFPASFSLALLYFTVMSFGTLMTAYLKWNGLNESILALYRGGGALSGILATIAFPHMHQHLRLIKTGMIAVWLQLACLMFGLLPMLFFDSNEMSENSDSNLDDVGDNIRSRPSSVVHILVIGLVLSRFGLWLFDLSVNQIMQETIDDSILSTVNGVQSGLQSGFQLASFVFGMIIYQPGKFSILMVGSVAVVVVAASLFSTFAIRSGHHIPLLVPQHETIELVSKT